MENYDLVMYGAYNLVSDWCVISTPNGERSHNRNVVRLPNVRGTGSTPVSRQVTEKSIFLQGYIKARDSLSLSDCIRDLNQSLDVPNRYLRFCKRWSLISNPVSSNGWFFTNDSTTKDYEVDKRIFSGSISFNADVSLANGEATIYSESNQTVDLGEYQQRGNFEIGIYIPEVENITSASFRVGSSSANYLDSGELTQQYDYKFTQGWNWLSIRWENMMENGVVDPYSIGSYVYASIKYNASQDDVDGFKFGGLIWQDDTQTRNYRAEGVAITLGNEHYENTHTSLNLDVLCYNGVSEATSLENAYTQSAVTTASNSFSIDTLGSYSPEPIVSISLGAITNLNTISVTNQTTGDSVTVDETWVVDDLVVIDTSNKEVTRNNVGIDYTSVLPRFVLGRNVVNISLTSTSQETQQQTTQNANLTGEV